MQKLNEGTKRRTAEHAKESTAKSRRDRKEKRMKLIGELNSHRMDDSGGTELAFVQELDFLSSFLWRAEVI